MPDKKAAAKPAAIKRLAPDQDKVKTEAPAEKPEEILSADQQMAKSHEAWAKVGTQKHEPSVKVIQPTKEQKKEAKEQAEAEAEKKA